MAESELIRHPNPTGLDYMNGVLKWNYTIGLELLALMDAGDRYGDPRMEAYALRYADTIINARGEIYKYKKENYNLDHICPGRMLFRLWERTGQERFRMTLDRLREQLDGQPRTSEGGFWHKKVYPWQMWLDGLYMGEPFYAEYALRFETGQQQRASFDDIVNQFLIVAEHTRDSVTGLYRHAWDESRSQFWADPRTGQSAHIWGRALGWYVMALVETLDYLPSDHPGHAQMVALLRDIYERLPRYADRQTGMWYQVLELPNRQGNYLESTCSAMFVYGMLKSVRKGYLDPSLAPKAEQGYRNFIRTFIREEKDGTISVTNCCAVAGLGGKDRRDGSFEYYIGELVRDNDAKAVGPFIWASLEYETLHPGQ